MRDGGCYGHVDGPRFNTRTEIATLRHAASRRSARPPGPETVLAGEARIPYALLGYATDYANGVADEPTPVEELVRLIGESTGDVRRHARRRRCRALDGGALEPVGHPSRLRLTRRPRRRRRRRARRAGRPGARRRCSARSGAGACAAALAARARRWAAAAAPGRACEATSLDAAGAALARRTATTGRSCWPRPTSPALDAALVADVARRPRRRRRSSRSAPATTAPRTSSALAAARPRAARAGGGRLRRARGRPGRPRGRARPAAQRAAPGLAADARAAALDPLTPPELGRSSLAPLAT